VRPEGLCQWKISNDNIGDRTHELRVVAQSFNQLRHRVHIKEHINTIFRTNKTARGVTPLNLARNTSAYQSSNCSHKLFSYYGKTRNKAWLKIGNFFYRSVFIYTHSRLNCEQDSPYHTDKTVLGTSQPHSQ
jgi:hypothetical protein